MIDSLDNFYRFGATSLFRISRTMSNVQIGIAYRLIISALSNHNLVIGTQRALSKRFHTNLRTLNKTIKILKQYKMFKANNGLLCMSPYVVFKGSNQYFHTLIKQFNNM